MFSWRWVFPYSSLPRPFEVLLSFIYFCKRIAEINAFVEDLPFEVVNNLLSSVTGTRLLKDKQGLLAKVRLDLYVGIRFCCILLAHVLRFLFYEARLCLTGFHIYLNYVVQTSKVVVLNSVSFN